MDHLLILNTHNLTRWAVLGTAAWAVTHAWRGHLAGRPWGPGDRLPGLTFTTVLNLQFVVGLILYFTSPLVRPVFSSAGYAASSTPAAVFSVIHPLAMTTAAVLAQVVYSVAKRAPAGRRFRVAAAGYAATVALILFAVPWPFLPYGRPLLPGG